MHKRFAKEDTALGALQRSTAKDHGQRHKVSLAEGNFGIERSYRKRLAKDMKHSEAKSNALKKRTSNLGKTREVRDSAGRHVFTRVKEHDGWKTYKAKKGGVDEHA